MYFCLSARHNIMYSCLDATKPNRLVWNIIMTSQTYEIHHVLSSFCWLYFEELFRLLALLFFGLSLLLSCETLCGETLNKTNENNFIFVFIYITHIHNTKSPVVWLGLGDVYDVPSFPHRARSNKRCCIAQIYWFLIYFVVLAEARKRSSWRV